MSFDFNIVEEIKDSVSSMVFGPDYQEMIPGLKDRLMDLENNICLELIEDYVVWLLINYVNCDTIYLGTKLFDKYSKLLIDDYENRWNNAIKVNVFCQQNAPDDYFSHVLYKKPTNRYIID